MRNEHMWEVVTQLGFVRVFLLNHNFINFAVACISRVHQSRLSTYTLKYRPSSPPPLQCTEGGSYQRFQTYHITGNGQA